jgi:3-hydroxyacyl-[acyl-carrier-protein] dehydratase
MHGGIMRYFLLDRIDEIAYGKHITAVKCVSLSDDIFNEHFPGYPIFPGSLILEGLAQSAGTLFELSMMHENKKLLRSVLSIVTRMKFRSPVCPGDRMLLKAKIISVREDSGVAAVSAEVEGNICAEGELTFTFVDISNKTLEDNRMVLYSHCMRNAKVVP